MTERVGIQLEMKKNSLKQLQSGDWVVSFTASQIDFPTELATAAMGQRFMAVLVPLGDFEEAPKPKQSTKLARQAAMLCDDPRFRAFMNEYSGCNDENINACAGPAGTAAMVRLLCAVESRSEFDTNEEAAAKWRNLKASYDAWLQV